MANAELREQDDKVIAQWIGRNTFNGIVGDLGCGDGKILKYLKWLQYDVWGVDSQEDKLGSLPVEIIDNFKKVDLSKFVELPRADIVLSLEVAEHLPKDSEDIFIENLVNPEPKVIIMSVATLGQEAKSHFNLKPRRMWIEKIEAQGYKEDEVLEYKFKKDLHDKLQVKKWYIWNIIIFKKV